MISPRNSKRCRLVNATGSVASHPVANGSNFLWPNPRAALLWLEFMASAQGQAINDEYEPVSASVFSPGSVIEKIVRGKKAWIRDLQSIDKTQKWMAMAVEAFGFPRGN
jgi:hypothetical protein